MQITAIIPARYASTRFPGKPLADIQGKPMIQWVYERTRRAEYVDQVIVATDDERIERVVQNFGGQVRMTPSDCASGSDRAAVVAAELSSDIIINVQGDEPLVEPQAVDLLAQTLAGDKQADMATLVCQASDVQDLENPNMVRVVFDHQHRALYFSRSIVPYARDIRERSDWLNAYPYYIHIGMYAYRRSFLLNYKHLRESKLEQVEKLEQLRALENGYTIKIGIGDFKPICVDVPDDLERVNKELKS
ncbi:MAG: 3-deoxy-manno-octulosonate cytidylyltransferase [candidate division KSB1 bacterium]|nr:3-deoxy-manno-octulosonate cytidylyltransferase [candidate division KSB1 bacterium]